VASSEDGCISVSIGSIAFSQRTSGVSSDAHMVATLRHCAARTERTDDADGRCQPLELAYSASIADGFAG